MIGCGGISISHAQAVAAFPTRATVVAAADLAPERRVQFAGKCGIEPVEQVGEVLSRPDVDCVLIRLPNHLHAEVAVAAARAGKHILLEKPMANTLAECDWIMAAALRSCRGPGIAPSGTASLMPSVITRSS
jgi:predicted dehydrogenase